MSKKFNAGDIIEISTQVETILAYALCTDAGKLNRLSFLPVQIGANPSHDYDRVLPNRFLADCSRVIHFSSETINRADIKVISAAVQHLPDCLKTVALYRYDVQALDTWSMNIRGTKETSSSIRQAFSSAQRLFQRDPDEKTQAFFLESKKMLQSLDRER